MSGDSIIWVTIFFMLVYPRIVNRIKMLTLPGLYSLILISISLFYLASQHYINTSHLWFTMSMFPFQALISLILFSSIAYIGEVSGIWDDLAHVVKTVDDRVNYISLKVILLLPLVCLPLIFPFPHEMSVSLLAIAVIMSLYGKKHEFIVAAAVSGCLSLLVSPYGGFLQRIGEYDHVAAIKPIFLIMIACMMLLTRQVMGK